MRTTYLQLRRRQERTNAKGASGKTEDEDGPVEQVDGNQLA